eukprot:6256863-Pyramimonas_sp.AAC.1
MASQGAWAIHMTTIYNTDPDHLRHYVNDGVCRACGIDHRTRPGLLVHLTHSKRKCVSPTRCYIDKLPHERVQELGQIDEKVAAALRSEGYDENKAKEPTIRNHRHVHLVLPEDDWVDHKPEPSAPQQVQLEVGMVHITNFSPTFKS